MKGVVLRRWQYLLGDRYTFNITLRPHSESEPDIAVVRVDSRRYLDYYSTPDEIFSGICPINPPATEIAQLQLKSS